MLLIVRASREMLACENTRFSLVFADVFAGYRNLLKLMSSSNQIWVVTRHHYEISAYVPQTLFRRETSSDVTKFYVCENEWQ